MQNDSSAIARRHLLSGAAASLVVAPAVVRAANLMPVRGIIFPTERHYFGFVDRLYVHINLPTITELQKAGLSAYEIAAEMNILKRAAINGDAWNGQHVISILKRNELMRRQCQILRSFDALNARECNG
jgi:hypothetical protein